MKTFKKLILDDMKKMGLAHAVENVKSIRYRSFAGGNAVDVETVNLFKSDREKLEALLWDYQAGHFDGMQDMYEYKSGPAVKERTAKYVHLRNEFTEETKAQIKAILEHDFGVTDDQTSMTKLGVWYDQAIYRELVKLEGVSK